MTKRKRTLDFTAGQAAALLGMQPASFQNWVNRGIVPFQGVKKAKRTRRTFTDANVRVLAVIRALYALGFEPAFAASLAPAVNRHLYRHVNQRGFVLLAPCLRGLDDEFECTTTVLDDNGRLPIPEPFASREALIVINLPAVRAIVHRAMQAVHWEGTAVASAAAPEEPGDNYTLSIPLDPETGEPVAEQAVVVPGHAKGAAEPAGGKAQG